MLEHAKILENIGLGISSYALYYNNLEVMEYTSFERHMQAHEILCCEILMRKIYTSFCI